jgi:hypothetical protein
VASDIREILTSTSESATEPATESLDIHSEEYRKLWFATGPSRRRLLRRPQRKLGEMV